MKGQKGERERGRKSEKEQWREFISKMYLKLKVFLIIVDVNHKTISQKKNKFPSQSSGTNFF